MTMSRKTMTAVGIAANDSWLSIIASLLPKVPPDRFITSSISEKDEISGDLGNWMFWEGLVAPQTYPITHSSLKQT